MGVNLDNFPLPDVAAQDLRRQNRHAVSLADGVSSYAGHDSGVPFRFFIHTEEAKPFLPARSKKYMPQLEVEMIEFMPDRFNRPTERLRHLSPELLEFDDETGECIGGRYATSYKRWKEGLSAPGLPISKWGELSDGWIATLVKNGIFSVEQLAALPRSKVDQYGPAVVEAFEKALGYVAKKDGLKVSAEHAEHIASLEARIAELEGGKARKPGKQKKEQEAA